MPKNKQIAANTLKTAYIELWHIVRVIALTMIIYCNVGRLCATFFVEGVKKC